MFWGASDFLRWPLFIITVSGAWRIDCDLPTEKKEEAVLELSIKIPMLMALWHCNCFSKTVYCSKLKEQFKECTCSSCIQHYTQHLIDVDADFNLSILFNEILVEHTRNSVLLPCSHTFSYMTHTHPQLTSPNKVL